MTLERGVTHDSEFTSCGQASSGMRILNQVRYSSLWRLTGFFVEPSGTGKTLAAEVLAYEPLLHLYCAALSQVVTK